MQKEKSIDWVKKYRTEAIILLTVIVIYSLRGLILSSAVLSSGVSIFIQMWAIPLIYVGMLIWMIVKKTVQSSNLSKFFFQSYLLFVFPVHVMIYYMIFTDFNLVILYFIGIYFLFCASFFLFVRIKAGKIIRITFWMIDSVLQIVFIYIWILVIGIQNISV